MFLTWECLFSSHTPCSLNSLRFSGRILIRRFYTANSKKVLLKGLSTPGFRNDRSSASSSQNKAGGCFRLSALEISVQKKTSRKFFPLPPLPPTFLLFGLLLMNLSHLCGCLVWELLKVNISSKFISNPNSPSRNFFQAQSLIVQVNRFSAPSKGKITVGMLSESVWRFRSAFKNRCSSSVLVAPFVSDICPIFHPPDNIETDTFY